MNAPVNRIKTMRAIALSTSFLLPFTLWSSPVLSEEDKKGWEQGAMVYLFAPAISGDTGVRNVTIPVDVSFSDILDSLQLGGFALYEARKDDQWSFIADVGYLQMYNKTAPVSNNVITVNTKTQLSQIVLEAMVGYKVIDYENPESFSGNVTVDLIGGARYNQLKLKLGADVSVLGFATSAERKKTVDWIDPIVGFKARYNPSKQSELTFYGDVGGFGVGSDLTWQIFAGYTYTFENDITLTGGYRALYMDYEEGSGTSYFSYDATYYGPMIGLGYRF